ncbi:phosphoribosylaminoimidazolesuccinocarboxamide synthase [Pedobacter aquae]|uniref:Phosphoribosylaminoimidazole-succinocarboxamide synthase n=1 Tax=Pedobacter aquae TaxID=2605747 RepID=A0A5C0VIK2_9SPHI|nr:phosphoribosylaminoimidazolesuccinocarboxamide synthase [Pedobacter aquae]QEK51521.1 phosphoribosylaminoimidazolesuccinocarboxamide synthase [Pedobacter aquae]
MKAIKETKFNLPGQTNFYKGKVRDVYTIQDKYLVMVVSDRISAFDVVLPEPIPFKGQVLNQIAAKFLAATQDIVPNWVITVPDPSVTIGKICEPFKVEMVIRGYLAGHAAREYAAGKRVICGVQLPEGLKENDKLPEPIITPTTKAAVGHDEDISKEDILKRAIVSEEDYLQLEDYTRKLYQRGTEIAAEQGLILVDTKYEFGKADGKIHLIDEIHTPDSSRYFYKEGYGELQASGKPQRQLSKEFVRQWLIENNFQGKDGQVIPEMNEDRINSISERYIELFEKITGEEFKKAATEDINDRVESNILKALAQL